MGTELQNFSKKGTTFEVISKSREVRLDTLNYGDLFYLVLGNDAGSESIFMYLGQNDKGQPNTIYYISRRVDTSGTASLYMHGNTCFIPKDSDVVKIKFKEIKNNKIIFEEV